MLVYTDVRVSGHRRGRQPHRLIAALTAQVYLGLAENDMWPEVIHCSDRALARRCVLEGGGGPGYGGTSARTVRADLTVGNEPVRGYGSVPGPRRIHEEIFGVL